MSDDRPTWRSHADRIDELPASPAPVTPETQDSAERALAFVQHLPGDGWLAGQEENDDAVDDEQAYIEMTTGRKPALRGFDLAAYIVDPVDEAIRSFAEDGQLITLSWHVGGPPADSSDFEHCFADTSVEACLTDGTEEHAIWRAKLERVADRLAVLRDAGVPVFFRPFHEMDGGWFWWSNDGPETYRRLWRDTFDYLAVERELNNLLWVWSASHEFATDAWYPGDDVVDVTGVDTYRDQKPELDWGEHFADTRETAPEKPVALTECDIIPHPDGVPDSYPFVWFLPWHTSVVRSNDPDHLQAVYAHPDTLTAADLPPF